MAEIEPAPLVTTLDQYRMVRQQIEHEDNLISQRLSWLLGSQSFLFTAFAITVNGPPQVRSHAIENTVGLLVVLVPLVSIVSSVLIGLSVIAGMLTMRKLRHTYAEELGRAFGEELPHVQSTGGALLLGQMAPVLLPALFVVVWFWLILRS